MKEIAHHDERIIGRQSLKSATVYDQLKKARTPSTRPALVSFQSLIQGYTFPSGRDDRLASFIQRPHQHPMLSLDNTYSQEELYAFDKRLRKIVGEGS